MESGCRITKHGGHQGLADGQVEHHLQLVTVLDGFYHAYTAIRTPHAVTNLQVAGLNPMFVSREKWMIGCSDDFLAVDAQREDGFIYVNVDMQDGLSSDFVGRYFRISGINVGNR